MKIKESLPLNYLLFQWEIKEIIVKSLKFFIIDKNNCT